MKTKKEVDDTLKTMFSTHKKYMDTALFDHDTATERVLDSYNDFYEWVIDEKYKEKKWYNEQTARTLAWIMMIIGLIGLIIMIIGWVL